MNGGICYYLANTGPSSSLKKMSNLTPPPAAKSAFGKIIEDWINEAKGGPG